MGCRVPRSARRGPGVGTGARGGGSGRRRGVGGLRLLPARPVGRRPRQTRRVCGGSGPRRPVPRGQGRDPVRPVPDRRGRMVAAAVRAAPRQPGGCAGRRRGGHALRLLLGGDESPGPGAPDRPTGLVVGGDRALVGQVLADSRLRALAERPRRELYGLPTLGGTSSTERWSAAAQSASTSPNPRQTPARGIAERLGLGGFIHPRTARSTGASYRRSCTGRGAGGRGRARPGGRVLDRRAADWSARDESVDVVGHIGHIDHIDDIGANPTPTATATPTPMPVGPTPATGHRSRPG